MIANDLKLFDDTQEHEARSALYERTPALHACRIVANVLALGALLLALSNSRWCAPVGLAWAVLASVSATCEWRAGLRATPKNQIAAVVLLMPTLLVVLLTRA